MEISLAPMQGYTDYHYRNALYKTIGGVDKFYIPYLRYENDKSIRKKHLNEVLPENNTVNYLVPQILVNNATDFLNLTLYLQDLGYSEINWNLGCPYPMVTNRKLGAGLIPYPEEIIKILDEVLPKISAKISIKTRLGLTSEKEVENLFLALQPYPIHELILHPRIAKQLYKGTANKAEFKTYASTYKNNWCYNGDICNLNDLAELKAEGISSSHMMIGRGLLKNPFLGLEIEKNESIDSSVKRLKLKAFHDSLYHEYTQKLSGNSHQLHKLKSLWEYLSYVFVNQHKCLKSIKKARTTNAYTQIVECWLNSEEIK